VGSSFRIQMANHPSLPEEAAVKSGSRRRRSGPGCRRRPRFWSKPDPLWVRARCDNAAKNG
jgi:hypothetical protein